MDIACEGEKDNDINCNLLCSSSSLLSLTAVKLLQKEKSVTRNPFCWIILNEFLINGLFQEKNKLVGWWYLWNFQGYWRNSKQIFQGLIKKNMDFLGMVKKKSCRISSSLVMGLKISEGFLYNTILWSF